MKLKRNYQTPALLGMVVMSVASLAYSCNNRNPVSCSEMHNYVEREIDESTSFSHNYLQCTGSPSNCTGTNCTTPNNNFITFPLPNCTISGSNISAPDTNGKVTLSPGTYFISYSFTPSICQYNAGDVSVGAQIITYVNNLPTLETAATWDSLSGTPTVAVKSVSGQFIVAVADQTTSTVNVQYFVQGTGFLPNSKFAIDANQIASLCSLPNPVITNGASFTIQQIAGVNADRM